MRIQHHSGDCTLSRDTPGPADAWQDYFCDCHGFREPVVLENGNIAWPCGWTRAQVRAWRLRHRLLAPERLDA